MGYLIGIDIGSTCAKTVVLNEERQILHRLLQPTGWSSVETAEAIRSQLTARDVAVEASTVVATGYGRVSVPYADKRLTEITCHGQGACHIYGEKDLVVIDVGGQDTKLIVMEGGAVKDFVMNDKCSAGTGRFLEIMANTLSVRLEELEKLASQGGGTTISSMCTVFAESEVIGLIGRGEPRENIAFAVMDSIIQKVASQAGRLRLNAKVCLTGGLCGFSYFRSALSAALGTAVDACEDGRYAGAVGAALNAASLRGACGQSGEGAK